MRSFAALFVGFVAWLVGDALRVRRSHVEAAMVRAGIVDARSRARAMYRALATSLLEFLAMVSKPATVLARVAVPDSAIREIRGRGRGAVIATAHTGNWDVAACAVARAAPLSVVTKRLHVRALDAFWQGARRRRGLKLLEVGRAARGAESALRRGELVAMLIDQAPERSRGVARTTFLGDLAWVDLAPALIAMRAGSPLVIAFPRRCADGSHTIEVAKILEPPAVPSRAWATQAMLEATRALETFVMSCPEQWLWMHRRWKPLPALPGASLAGESA